MLIHELIKINWSWLQLNFDNYINGHLMMILMKRGRVSAAAVKYRMQKGNSLTSKVYFSLEWTTTYTLRQHHWHTYVMR